MQLENLILTLHMFEKHGSQAGSILCVARIPHRCGGLGDYFI